VKIPYSKGMTFIEIVVAGVVLVVLFGGIYKLFQSGSSVMRAGFWVNKAQNQVRNTLTLIRDEINHSNRFLKVTENGPDEMDAGKYVFKFKKGIIDSSFDGPIFQFYQCQTRVEFGGKVEKEGSAVFCEISKKGSNLVMKKVVDTGTPIERLFPERVLLENVTQIKTGSVDGAKQEQMVETMISFLITVTDPLQPDRSVTEETKAKVDAKVVNM